MNYYSEEDAEREATQQQEEFDAMEFSEEADDVEIDKCLNCGRYKATDSLNVDQVCAKGCRNPNEY